MDYATKSFLEMLTAEGIFSTSVLHVMSRVRRHDFVSEALRYRAYDNASLPIGFGQTISKPAIIGKMIQSLGLRGYERVLEIGTGSGYQAALLSGLAGSVVTIERIKDLAFRAESILKRLRCDNVTVMNTGDYNEVEGLFDAIIVAAGADVMPADLMDKFRTNGVLVIPIADNDCHYIKRFLKGPDGSYNEEIIGMANFVPLILTG